MRYFFLVSFCLFQICAFAQNVQFTRYSSQPIITPEVVERISQIPELKLLSKGTEDLPSHVDNSTKIYFPPIFNQKGNSCSQASGIRYMFSYHINALRNLSALQKENVYSYHYTWNFLNQGTDMGSWYFDGYDLVMCNGAPSIVDLPDDHFLTNQRTWMTGYDKYYNAMRSRIESYFKIKADDADGLEKIKSYIHNQANGAEHGGLLNFSGKTTGWTIVPYSGSSGTGYKSIISKFGNGGDHAMVFAGYDDNVEFDLDGDGQISTDERGALIVVNSWGNGWGDNGRAYMPYKLLKQSYWSGGIGNGDKYVYGIKAKDHQPKVTGKIRLSYTSRNDLWFIIGVANESSAQSQQKSKVTKIFNKQGGDYYMLGGSVEGDKEIEIGFDYSELLETYPDAKKFFITIKQSPTGSLGEGKVLSFSVIDYRQASEAKEYTGSASNITISGSHMLSAMAVLSSTSQVETEATRMLTISPNPVMAGGVVHAKVPTQSQNKMEVTLYSSTGALVYSWGGIDASNGHVKFSMPSWLPQNLYIVSVKGGGEHWRARILIN